MAGYSKTKLIDKLGIKPGYSILIVNAPESYLGMLGKLPVGVRIQKKPVRELDFIHFFTKEKNQLEKNFPIYRDCLSKSGLIWISWPKIASKVKTNVSENLVRVTGLNSGMVDVKICAVDEVWSGLKFVFRLTDR